MDFAQDDTCVAKKASLLDADLALVAENLDAYAVIVPIRESTRIELKPFVAT